MAAYAALEYTDPELYEREKEKDVADFSKSWKEEIGVDPDVVKNKEEVQPSRQSASLQRSQPMPYTPEMDSDNYTKSEMTIQEHARKLAKISHPRYVNPRHRKQWLELWHTTQQRLKSIRPKINRIQQDPELSAEEKHQELNNLVDGIMNTRYKLLLEARPPLLRQKSRDEFEKAWNKANISSGESRTRKQRGRGRKRKRRRKTKKHKRRRRRRKKI